MKIKQTVKKYVFSALVVAGLLAVVTPVATFAASCGGVDTSIISCDQTGGSGSGIDNSGVWGILLLAINILTAGVGVAAVGGIVYGAVLYTTAAGAPEQIKKAMEIIRNVVIGIVAYALMYAVLNFLVPGGIFT
jgi:hypothetical protein